MVVKVALGMSCGLHCWIFVGLFFLFSDLITNEMEEAPNKRNALASLTDDARCQDPLLPPRSLLVLLQMCLLLLEPPNQGL